jgi:ribosomal-protein-alanine N-acetyltransferase
MVSVTCDIQPMTEEHIEAVLELERDLFSDPWPESMFREDIVSARSYPVVAYVDNELAGYAILWHGIDEGHLTNIAVRRDLQRKSVAKRLLSYILQRALAHHMREVFLEVRISNEPAISLYEKFGFQKVAIRKNYYRQPAEDCLVMRVILGKGYQPPDV